MAHLSALVLMAELLRRSLFVGGALQALLAEQPWQAWAVGNCVLIALFAQNCGACQASGWHGQVPACLPCAPPWHTASVAPCILPGAGGPAVPWTFARLGSAALGIPLADEAPVGFLRSSASPRTFWRNFHVRHAARSERL